MSLWLLLRAALCLAESREPLRLVLGSHRSSPRPGAGSEAAGGGGGGGGSLTGDLGLGNCLRLHDASMDRIAYDAYPHPPLPRH